jgi:hypothetical protein
MKMKKALKKAQADGKEDSEEGESDEENVGSNNGKAIQHGNKPCEDQASDDDIEDETIKGSSEDTPINEPDKVSPLLVLLFFPFSHFIDIFKGFGNTTSNTQTSYEDIFEENNNFIQHCKSNGPGQCTKHKVNRPSKVQTQPISTGGNLF